MIQASTSSQYWQISSCTWEGTCKLVRYTVDSVLSPINDIGPGVFCRRISVMIMTTEKHLQVINRLTRLGRVLPPMIINLQRELDKFGRGEWGLE